MTQDATGYIQDAIALMNDETVAIQEESQSKSM
jgi:hypothetical protein